MGYGVQVFFLVGLGIFGLVDRLGWVWATFCFPIWLMWITFGRCIVSLLNEVEMRADVGVTCNARKGRCFFHFCLAGLCRDYIFPDPREAAPR